jgi:hypothetical protein
MDSPPRRCDAVLECAVTGGYVRDVALRVYS